MHVPSACSALPTCSSFPAANQLVLVVFLPMAPRQRPTSNNLFSLCHGHTPANFPRNRHAYCAQWTLVHPSMLPAHAQRSMAKFHQPLPCQTNHLAHQPVPCQTNNLRTPHSPAYAPASPSPSVALFPAWKQPSSTPSLHCTKSPCTNVINPTDTPLQQLPPMLPSPTSLLFPQFFCRQ